MDKKAVFLPEKDLRPPDILYLLILTSSHIDSKAQMSDQVHILFNSESYLPTPIRALVITPMSPLRSC